MPEITVSSTHSDDSPFVDRDELANYLREYLRADEGEDYCPNGLQVSGNHRIRRLVTGVTACQELFRRAAELDAQAVLVHHGIFLHGRSQVLTGALYERVRLLMANDLSLFGYHLPLDRHPVVGNNILAAQALGLDELQPFAPHKGLPTGYRGTLPESIPVQELADRCAVLFRQTPLLLAAGERPVRRVGIVSGAAQGSFRQAIDAGLDAFITGEVSEWVLHMAREEGVHFLAAGHYATERLGVQVLGAHIAHRYGIDTRFVELPNPV